MVFDCMINMTNSISETSVDYWINGIGKKSNHWGKKVKLHFLFYTTLHKEIPVG